MTYLYDNKEFQDYVTTVEKCFDGKRKSIGDIKRKLKGKYRPEWIQFALEVIGVEESGYLHYQLPRKISHHPVDYRDTLPINREKKGYV